MLVPHHMSVSHQHGYYTPLKSWYHIANHPISSFFLKLLWLSQVFFISIYILENLINLLKTISWNVSWDCIGFGYQFRDHWELNINSSDPEIEYASPFFKSSLIFSVMYSLCTIYTYFIKCVPKYFIVLCYYNLYFSNSFY